MRKEERPVRDIHTGTLCSALGRPATKEDAFGFYLSSPLRVFLR